MQAVNVNQLLSQLRTLAAQADAHIPAPAGPATAAAKSGDTAPFGAVLSQALDQVNQSQLNAHQAADAFATGRGDLPTAMLAASRAQVQFRAAVEVRNRLVQAYREVMQMTM